MDFDFSPKFSQKIFDGEGGSYDSWSSSEFPLLSEAKVGAGKLVLHPHGFGLPHYADSSKVGCVLQGTEGIVGMVLPNSSEEVVLKLKKGDLIPVPLGALSWWYNKGDSDLVIAFLGETSKSYVPGEFTYFLLTGGQGILGGFSSEFNSKAYNLSEKEANILAKSQAGVLIIKLEEKQSMPHPCMDFVHKMVYHIDAATPKILTGTEFPFLEEAGLSVEHVRLVADAMLPPTYSANATARIFYVAQGNGMVQIVGLNGKRVLDTKVKAGQLFVVPRFFAVAAIAGEEGMGFFSILTTTRPALKDFVGSKSIWNILSPKVLQASLSVTPEFAEHFRSNIGKSAILNTPKN